MVFENIVVSILKKYVGKYLKNFDTDNFSLGLWKGDVSLIDLELKEEVLLEYDLPVAINGGYVGKLSLEIPWSSIFTSPVVVKITDVFILTGPQAEKPYDEEKEKKSENTIKQNQLRLLKKGSHTNLQTKKAEDDTFAEKLTAQIIKNVQIYISNVHIRYEDSKTSGKYPFAFGVTLSDATAVTATSDWLPTFVDGSVRQIYKLIELKRFAVYWNSNATLLLKDNPNWKAVMKSQISRSDQKDLNHEFLLRPLMLTVRLSIDQNAKILMDKPKFEMAVLLDELSLELSKFQFEGMLDLIDMFELMQVNQQYRKYRPLSTLDENPEEWWKYMFRSYIETQYLPWTWEKIKEHRAIYKDYVTIYLEKLTAVYQNNKKDIKDVSRKVTNLEEKLDVVNILLARKQAEIKFNRMKSSLDIKQKETESVGWLEWLGIVGQYDSSDDDVEEKSDKTKTKGFSMDDLSEKDKDELYKAIDYLDDKTHPTYSKTYVRSRLSFHLKRCDMSLRDSKSKKQILSFKLKDLSTMLLEKPGSECYSLKLDVNSFDATGGKKDVIKGDGEDNVLHLIAEVNPVELEADYLFSLYTQPITIFYCQEVARSIENFFTTQNDAKLKQLEVAAGERIEEIGKASRAGIEYAISRNKSIYFDVIMKSPTLILPQQNKDSEKFFQLYLGDVHAKTVLQKRSNEIILREATESDLESMFYHQTVIQFSNVHFQYSFLDQNTRLLQENYTYIIPPLCFEIDLFQCIESGYSNFPDFKIIGTLPSFSVYLREDIVVELFQMFNYFFPPVEEGNQHISENWSISESSKRRSSSIISKHDIAALQEMIGAVSSSNLEHMKSSTDEINDTDTALEVNTESSYDSDIASFDRTKLILHFEIVEVSLVYALTASKKEVLEDFILMTAKGISLDVKTHMWDVSITAQLSSFQLKDLIHPNFYSAESYILNSIQSQDLIQIQCIQAAPDGPAFKSKFNQTETKLQIIVGIIKSQIEQETMRQINLCMQTLSAKMDSTRADTAKSSVKKELHSIAEEEEEHDVEAKKSLSKVEDTVMDKVNLDIGLTIESACITLSSNGEHLAEFRTSGFNLGYLSCPGYQNISTRLKEICLQNSLVSQTVVQGLTDQLVQGKILLNNDVGRETMVPDYDIKFCFGKLDLYFDIQLMERLLKFYNAINIGGLDQLPKPPTVETSIFPKVKADISIDAPTLTIPRDEFTDKSYSFDFGKILLQNNIKKQGGILASNLYVNIEDVAFISNVKEKSKCNILSPFNLSMTLSRTLLEENVKWTGNISIPLFMVKIFDSDLKNFIGIYNECMKRLMTSNQADEKTPYDMTDYQTPAKSSSSAADNQIISTKSSLDTIDSQISVKQLATDDPFEMKLTANLDKLDIQLFTCAKNSEEVMFLSVSMERYMANIFKNQKKLIAEMSLNNFLVVEKFNEDWKDDGFFLLQSTEDEDMLKLSYTLDESIDESSLSVNFTKTLINLNAFSLLNLRTYVESLLEIINKMEPTSSNIEELTESQNSMNVESKGIQSNMKQKISVCLDDVVVTIFNRKLTTAIFQSESFVVSLDQNQEELQVEVQLDFLKITDADEKTNYPCILSVIDDKMVAIKFNQYKKPTNETSDEQIQVNSVWLRMGRVNIFFVYKFIAEVMACIEPLMAASASPSSQTKEDKVLQQELMVDADIQSPSVVIPKSSTANEQLIVDMGRFVMKTKEKSEENERNANIFCMQLIDSNMSILAESQDGHHSSRSPCIPSRITNKLSANASLHLPISADENSLKIDVAILPVKVDLTDVQIILLLSLFQNNFAEAQATHRNEKPNDEETPAAESMNYKIMINIDQIDLNLNSEELFKEKVTMVGRNSIEICQISLASLTTKLFMDSEKMKLNLQISEIMGYDRRPYSHASPKNFLSTSKKLSPKDTLTTTSPASSSSQQNQICMELLTYKTDTKIDMDIAGSKIILDVNFLSDFNAYLSNIFIPKGGHDPVERNEHTDSTDGENRSQEGKLSVKVNVNDTTVVVLQVPTESPSPALLFYVTASVLYDASREATNVDMQHCLLEILFGDFPSTESRPKPLLYPCHLKCHMSSKPPDIMNVDLKIDRMRFCMSPAILTSIIHISDNLMKKEDDASTVEDVEKIIDWNPQPVNEEDYLSNDSIQGQENDHLTSSINDEIKQKAIVAIDSIEFTLGNDYQGSVVPLLKGKLSARTKLTNWLTWPSFEGDLTAQMSYYNNNLGIFEPLLEPRTSGEFMDPFELNVKLFYGESEKLNFSTRAMMNCGESDFIDSSVDVIDCEESGSSNEQEKRALFLLISSEEEMEITVTSHSLPILLSLSESYSLESLHKSKHTQLVAPLSFNSMLGIPATVFIDQYLSGSKAISSQLTIKKKVHCNSSVNTTSSNVTNSVSRNRGSLALLKPRHLADSSAFSYSTSALDKVKEYREDTEAQTECCNYSIDIKIDGFDVVKDVSIKTQGMSAYTLFPSKNGFAYRLVVEVKIESGQRIISLASNWIINNYLMKEIVVKTDDGLLNVPANSEKSLPLLKTNTQFLGLSVDKYEVSEEISTGDIENGDKMMFLTCHNAQETSDTISLKMRTKNCMCTMKNQLPTSVQRIEVLPPVRLQNQLPYDISYNLKENVVSWSLTAGSYEDLLIVDPTTKNFQLYVQMSIEDTKFQGKCNIDSINKQTMIVTMSTDDGMPPFTIQIRSETKNDFFKITIYPKVLLVNKTGLPMEFKSQDNHVYRLSQHHNEKSNFKPRLINAHHKKTTGSIRLIEGEWSDSFLINTIGDEFSLNCKSRYSLNHYVHVGLQLSNTGMTQIVTISPRYYITNHSTFCIRFKETMESLDEFEVQPGKCSAVWVNEPEQGLRIKELDGAYIGNAIPWIKNGKYAKRLSNGETITIVCTHVGDRFLLDVTSYQEGSIPLRVDNFCSDVSIFIEQAENEKDWERVQILPTYSQFFNWSDLRKPFLLSLLSPYSGEKLTDLDVSMDGHGRIHVSPQVSANPGVVTQSSSCCSCCPWSRDRNAEENEGLISDVENVESRLLYWVCRFEGAQRVLAFTWDPVLAKSLRKNIDVELINMELFVSLRGIGLSLVNSEPREIIYASVTGGASVWEMESSPGKWDLFPVEVSTFLEDSFKNSVLNANFENKYQVEFEEMQMVKPRRCKVRRTLRPGFWMQYTQSKHNISLHTQVHRLQVDSQQTDVTFPTVLYPSPIPLRVLKRTGAKPFVEFSIVMSPQDDVNVIKYFKLLVQEFNVKLDRDFITGVSSLMKSATTEVDEWELVEKDRALLAEDMHHSINLFVSHKSNNLLIQYLHLSPMRIHLSFSLEGRVKSEFTSEEELFEWLISTVGIHFTDISDAEIKLAYFERSNILVSQSMLVADFSKHYTLQAVKQFHKLVLGLDVFGNPYGLVSEYGRGFKDLFYEPYLGSVAGPHQFAAGLVEGVRSLLGHTIGGTFGAASLITGQLGQVMAALTFDSEYKRRRRREMARHTSGIGGNLAIGGKQFVLGLMFGISGVVTKPVQGARQEGVEGFFKGVGKGIIGLLVKPTGGVIDLVTSSLDSVKRLAEQEGEAVVCRVRLPRVAYPGQPLQLFSKEKAYGFGLFKSMRTRHDIKGRFIDHASLPDVNHTVFVYTSQCILYAKQRKFFDYWQIEWTIDYDDLESVEKNSDDVIFKLKDSPLESISHSFIVPCILQAVAKLVFEKSTRYLHEYRESNF